MDSGSLDEQLGVLAKLVVSKEKKKFSLVFEKIGATGRQRATYELASVNNQS